MTNSHSKAMSRDMISSLPDAILDEILSRLPIGDAARTVVLSSRWRYKWASLPRLVFDESSFDRYPDNIIDMTHVTEVIDHILSLHRGPIEAFQLRLPVPDDAVDRWILRLSRTSVKDILFDSFDLETYTVPSCLYSFQRLTTLNLSLCSLMPLPSSFRGFNCLKSLGFLTVNVAQDVLEKLISSCPQLESLSLCLVKPEDETNLFPDLKIRAPNLRHFFGTLFQDVDFENAPNLTQVSVSCDGDIADMKSPAKSSSILLKFFHRLSSITTLCIAGLFMEHLSRGIEPSKLPNPCYDLDCFCFEMFFNDDDTSLAAHSILSIAPNLRTLKVIMVAGGDETDLEPLSDFWDNVSRSLVFPKLKLVEVANVSGMKPELDFIEFLLSNSPVLERLAFNVFYRIDQPELIQQRVLGLKQFSDTAEIICLDSVSSWIHDNDL